MDRRTNQFLEPERGGGMVGWAVKQLMLWSIGGFIVYALLGNLWLFRDDPPATAARPAVARGGEHAESRAAAKSAAAVASNALTLRARADGHVLVDAMVNGAPIRFLVDTGATWVSLTQEDARRAGVAGGLSYSMAMTTANGVAHAAPVTLRDVRIGELQVGDVKGTVMQAPGGISLLGQSFLKRLQSYDMRDGVLTLNW